MNSQAFWNAVKAILLKKQEILQVAQTTSNTLQIIYSLIQSVVAAKEILDKDPESSSRGGVVDLDEDAMAILTEYAK